MATTYAGEYTAVHPTVTTPSFSQRMEMGLKQASSNIYFEDPTTAGHATRAALANRIAQPGGATTFASTFVEYAAIQHFACDATTTDANIDSVTSSVWNLVAGA